MNKKEIQKRVKCFKLSESTIALLEKTKSEDEDWECMFKRLCSEKKIRKLAVIPKPINGNTGNTTNRLMELFRPVNPTINKLFAHKTQRDALERLVSRFGEQKIESTIKSLESIVTQKYAPRITTPLQLESKLGDLIIFYKQSQTNQPTHIKIN